ncbi:hypothetical protein CPB86DRAFT_779458 [Serendipita vermifera]|nr:hypothetical protein CPB86DRAFT_779458 [Serendipita vermifera]
MAKCLSYASGRECGTKSLMPVDEFGVFAVSPTSLNGALEASKQGDWVERQG